MNSTLCFFTVAMRMLSKAPWTDPMISPDVRQAAMVAISRGWFVKSENFTKYPFTRAELALAAGAYQGLLVPTIPDDTTVALRTIIDHLPHSCATMFTGCLPFLSGKAKRNSSYLFVQHHVEREWMDQPQDSSRTSATFLGLHT